MGRPGVTRETSTARVYGALHPGLYSCHPVRGSRPVNPLRVELIKAPGGAPMGPSPPICTWTSIVALPQVSSDGLGGNRDSPHAAVPAPAVSRLLSATLAASHLLPAWPPPNASAIDPEQSTAELNDLIQQAIDGKGILP